MQAGAFRTTNAQLPTDAHRRVRHDSAPVPTRIRRHGAAAQKRARLFRTQRAVRNAGNRFRTAGRNQFVPDPDATRLSARCGHFRCGLRRQRRRRPTARRRQAAGRHTRHDDVVVGGGVRGGRRPTVAVDECGGGRSRFAATGWATAAGGVAQRLDAAAAVVLLLFYDRHRGAAENDVR